MQKEARQSTPDSTRATRLTRLVVIGGFLGAGKTTAIRKLGQRLKRQDLTTSLISHDPGPETSAGGLFDSRFHSLAEAASCWPASPPTSIIVAEPSGSGTALAARLASQLPGALADDFRLAPLSILVDPRRAARIFGLETGQGFSDQVAAIYRQQIHEADFLIVNKADLISAEQLDRLKTALALQAPHAVIFAVSARAGTGLDEWFDQILTQERPYRTSGLFDNEIFAQGEALLGWLNCSVRLSSVRYFDAGQVLTDLANYMQSLLQQEGAEIAHLKITLTPSDDLGESAAINLVRNDALPELSQTVSEPIQSGEMRLNLRAEADPEVLNSAVNRALLTLMEKSPQLFARMEHSEHFRPAQPPPSPRRPVLAT